MKCNDFQYELNKNFIYNGEIELCKKGFYFCTRLNDVLGYYNLTDRNRFFKVKGLVNKKEYESLGKPMSYNVQNYYKDTKLVAKEIIFTNELTFKDIEFRKLIKQYISLVEESPRTLVTLVMS